MSHLTHTATPCSSEERLRQVLDASRMGFWEWQAEKNYFFYSAPFATILGYEADAFRPHLESLERLLHPDDRARVMQMIQTGEGNRSHFTTSYRLRMADGQWKWVELRAKVVAWDGAGRVARLVGIQDDVDRRIDSEKVLQMQLRFTQDLSAVHRLSEAYRSLLDNVMEMKGVQGTAVFLWDAGQDRLRLQYHRGLNEKTVEGLAGCHFGGVTLPRLKNGFSLFGPFRDFHFASFSRELRCRGAGLTPFFSLNRFEGVLLALGKEETLFSELEQFRLEALASVFGAVLSRLKTHETQRRSESFYRSTVNAMDDALLVLDPDLKVQLYNESVRGLAWKFGLALDAIQGRSIFHVAPFLGEDKRPQLERRLLAYQPFSWQQTVEGPMGKRIIELRVIPVRDENLGVLLENQKAQGLLVLIRDVTESLADAESIRKDKEQYALLLEQAREGIAVVKGDSFVYINPRLAEITGFNLKELRDMPIPRFLENPQWREQMEKNKAEGKEEADWVVSHKEGQRLYLQIHQTPVVWENQEADLLFMTDCTEQKETSDALTQLYEQYRQMVEKADMGIFVMQATLFRYINPEFERITGYSFQEVQQLDDSFDLIHPEDRPRARQFYAEWERNPEAKDQLTYRILHKNGQVITVHLYASCVRMEGQPVMLGFFHDVMEKENERNRTRELEGNWALGTQFFNLAQWEWNFNQKNLTFTGSLALGIGPKEPRCLLHGEAFLDKYLSRENIADFRCILWQPGEDGQTRAFAGKLRGADGQARPFRFAGTWGRNPEGDRVLRGLAMPLEKESGPPAPKKLPYEILEAIEERVQKLKEAQEAGEPDAAYHLRELEKAIAELRDEDADETYSFKE